MNLKQINIILLTLSIVAGSELLFGLFTVDDDLCLQELFFVPYWFIIKGWVTMNLVIFFYMYSLEDDKWNACFTLAMWMMIFFHLIWNIIGCDIFWKKCITSYGEVVRYLLSFDVFLGFLIFFCYIKIIFELHRLKLERRSIQEGYTSYV